VTTAVGWLVVLAFGLLHVLAASLAGGGAESRAEEAKKSRQWAQGPAAQFGLLRRALDADPPPVTLRPRHEGARPPQAAAA
jgi:hypothetical protein